MRVLILAVSLSLLCTAANAQTAGDVARVTKIMGRPQTASSTLSYMAGEAMRQGKLAEAIDHYSQMLSIYAADPGLGKDSAKYAWALARKGLCQKFSGQSQPAQESCRKALAIIGGMTPQNSPTEAQYLSAIVSDCSQVLAPALVKALIEAPTSKNLHPQLRTIALCEIPDLNSRTKEVEFELSKLTNKNDMNYLRKSLYLANLLTLGRKYDAAEIKFKEVIAVVEAMSGKESPGLAVPLSNYGYMLQAAGKVTEAHAIEERLRSLPSQYGAGPKAQPTN